MKLISGKIGVSISTHSDNNTDIGRYDIIEECLQSLIDIDPDVYINIISDGITDYHEKIINKFPFDHIKRSESGGISKVKNQGIDSILGRGYDYGFLIDDDVIFKDKEIFNTYTSTIIETDIPHYCLFLNDDGSNCNIEVVNNVSIKKTPWVNGCFLTFTRELIEKIGYFKVLTYRYGHEHSNFTRRSVHHKEIPFYCDVLNATDLLDINQKSLSTKSMKNIDQELFHINLIESQSNLGDYIGLSI